MTELLDIGPGRIAVRRVDGSLIFDSAQRMPHILGTLSVTGVTVEFPAVPGETWTGTVHNTPAHDLFSRQALAAYPSPVPPQFWWGKARVTQTAFGTFGGYQFGKMFLDGVMQPWTGSLWLERVRDRLIRHVNLAVHDGEVVLEKRQSGTGRSSVVNFISTTRSVFTLDADIAWGVFDE